MLWLARASPSACVQVSIGARSTSDAPAMGVQWKAPATDRTTGSAEFACRDLRCFRNQPVQCRLRFLRFRTRQEPRRSAPLHRCCRRAAGLRNRRKRQDTGNLVCRSSIGDRRSLRPARRGRLSGRIRQGVRRNARLLVRTLAGERVPDPRPAVCDRTRGGKTGAERSMLPCVSMRHCSR